MVVVVVPQLPFEHPISQFPLGQVVVAASVVVVGTGFVFNVWCWRHEAGNGHDRVSVDMPEHSLRILISLLPLGFTGIRHSRVR